MGGLLVKSYIAFLLIPLLTLAIEPSNPNGLCDRLAAEKEKTQCLQKTSDGNLDWYAASTCALYVEDKNFLTCLDEIKNSSFNPQALDLCAQSPDLSDARRSSCLHKIKNKDFSRKQIKVCSEEQSQEAIENCLASKSSSRSPASHTKPGFDSL